MNSPESKMECAKPMMKRLAIAGSGLGAFCAFAQENRRIHAPQGGLFDRFV
jgi:hypothetical protein